SQLRIERADEVRHLDAGCWHHYTVSVGSSQLWQTRFELAVAAGSQLDSVEAPTERDLELCFEVIARQVLFLHRELVHAKSRITCSAEAGLVSSSRYASAASARAKR